MVQVAPSHGLLVQDTHVAVVVAGAHRIRNAVRIKDIGFRLAVAGKERQALAEKVIGAEVALVVAHRIAGRRFVVIGISGKIGSRQRGENGGCRAA